MTKQEEKAKYREVLDEVLFNKDVDAARRLSMSRSTIWREMKAGRLRYIKVGASRLIPEEALQEYAQLVTREAAES